MTKPIKERLEELERDLTTKAQQTQNRPQESESEDPNSEPSGPVNREVLDRLEQYNANNNAAQQLASLAADPQIRRYLEAKQRGEEFDLSGSNKPNVGPSGNSSEDDSDLDNLDIDELSPRQLMDLMSKRVASKFDSQMKATLEPLQSKLQKLESSYQETQQEKISREVEEARKRHQDFDQFKPKMLELNQQNPGLSVEELYVLAKHQSGVNVSNPSTTNSERPTSSVARHKPANARAERPKGRGEFKSALNQTMSEILGE